MLDLFKNTTIITSMKNASGDNKKIKKSLNPYAKEVRTPKYKQRIIKSKKIYNRKNNESFS